MLFHRSVYLCFQFLNGYIKRTHLENCQLQERDLLTINQSKTEFEQRVMWLWKTQGEPIWKVLSERGAEQYAAASKKKMTQRKQSFSVERGVDKLRDPFLERNTEILIFELEQICQAFNLLEFGVEMAFLVIKLIDQKRLASLWDVLGVILKFMPYEKARYVLSKKREQLRRGGSPAQLKAVCDCILQRSTFSVHICFFLDEYMETNADRDRLRSKEWLKYSIHYQQVAGQTINSIVSNHMLCVLLEIPYDSVV